MKKQYPILILFLLIGAQSFAQTIYVDPLLSADCVGNYSVVNRDCSGSDGDAYKTLSSATNVAKAGMQVLIREGVYNVQLSPKYSGSENSYITFKNYGDEVVEITGESLAPAIWIKNKYYIVFEGLYVHDVDRWINALGCHHIIIRDNKFENALNPYGSSKTGLFFQACNNVKILNNIIHESTQDNIGLVDSDYNLIEGNTITKAYHVLWTLKCSNYNIIRGNYFHNEIQKIGEIYDCDGVGYGEGSYPKITSLDDTKYNVVEDNIFAYTASSGDHSPFSGIQYAAQNGIIRNNVFYECVGPPLSLTYYSDEAKFNYSNRISHNVFFDNDFGGIEISGTDSQNFNDQQIKNNIFYKNQFIQNDFRWSWYKELNNKPVQIFTGRDSEILIENNNIFSSEEDELYVVAFGSRFSSSNDAPESLNWWEANHSEAYKDNLQANPDFVDEGNKDFHLKEGSPMIDAGTFLTFTSSSGSDATNMEVDDAGWFMDGFGIISGDSIQLEGQSIYAIIVSIDYTTSTLTLDRALSWESGLGVSMKYDDVGPDIGAFEYSSASTGMSWNIPDGEEIKIIPNPSSGLLYVELGSADYIDKVFVYNSLGQSLMQLTSSSELDISGLQDGLYYINVFTRNGKIGKAKILKN
jgi:parallel beta-helix repeat protein